MSVLLELTHVDRRLLRKTRSDCEQGRRAGDLKARCCAPRDSALTMGDAARFSGLFSSTLLSGLLDGERAGALARLEQLRAGARSCSSDGAYVEALDRFVRAWRLYEADGQQPLLLLSALQEMRDGEPPARDALVDVFAAVTEGAETQETRVYAYRRGSKWGLMYHDVTAGRTRYPKQGGGFKFFRGFRAPCADDIIVETPWRSLGALRAEHPEALRDTSLDL